ncbi:MAG: hypothetical protein HY293_07090 [Planctomycetes bacterium]|nr:hypothetical protein [Planctomycetota bacterium]
MTDPFRWFVRIGAFLLLLSPLLQHCEAAGRRFSPILIMGELSPVLAPLERLGLALWLFVPLVVGAALLAGAWRGLRPDAALRALTLALLLAVSFALTTLGSVLLTQTGGGPQAPLPSFPLSLLLFLMPILLGGLALARLVGGDFARSTGGFVRLSLGLLLALNGLFLLDSGWDLLLPLIKQNGTPRALAGAWTAPAGGLLVVAGELLSRLRPRAAVDTAPASG